jgi:WLM domain
MAAFLLGIPFAAMVLYTQPDDIMTILDQEYDLLREELMRINEFPMLWKKLTITGMRDISPDGVGYNVGKGAEIYVCINGPINNVMHVLLHELAHNTVNEYDHSSAFWNNLGRLKEIAESIGIYEPIGTDVPFCNGTIGD